MCCCPFALLSPAHPPPPHISLLTFTEDQDTRTTQKKALGSKRKALRCQKVVSCFYLGLIAAVLPANHTPTYCPHFLETHFLVWAYILDKTKFEKRTGHGTTQQPNKEGDKGI
jgi:hypothetical protein